MRALCGAILAAGAMIGLGLTAIGYGIRYQTYSHSEVNPNTNQLYGAPSLMIILVVLLVGVGIGLGVAFLGLAFHHYRRYQEHLQRTRGGAPGPHATA
jgi:ABC-type Na+ efflux pump permease subunit